MNPKTSPAAGETVPPRSTAPQTPPKSGLGTPPLGTPGGSGASGSAGTAGTLGTAGASGGYHDLGFPPANPPFGGYPPRYPYPPQMSGDFPQTDPTRRPPQGIIPGPGMLPKPEPDPKGHGKKDSPWDEFDDFATGEIPDENRESVKEFHASRVMRPQAYPNPNELMTRQPGAYGKPQLMLDFPWYFELIAVVITALAISSLVRTFLLQPFYIPSGSMQDTLMINDSVLVTKMAPRYSELNRGDIVVFRDTENWLQSDREGAVKRKQQNPVMNAVKRFLIFVGLAPEDADGYLIKRVIGLGGDNVSCCGADGLMNINGKAIDEDYIPQTGVSSEVEFSVVVPKGALWVMGDNRNHSADSRYHMDKPSGGFVKTKDVVGRAFVVIWPMEHMRFISPSCAFYNIPKPALEEKDAFSSQSQEVPSKTG